MTLKAHFDGKTIVLDEPVPLSLASGTRLKISIEAIEDAPVPQRFQPLNVQIDPELSNAVALDPAFNIEES